MRLFRILPVLLALCSFTAHSAAAAGTSQPSDTLLACLRAAAPLVILPGDAAYQTATLVFNRDQQHHPLAIVEVETAANIQAVVTCGRDAKRRVVVRSGGHGFEGHAIGDDVIVIDLKRMRNIQISADKNTATVDAGATLGDLYYAAWTRARRGFPAGSCPGVGVSGLLLGGGHGMWARKYGMACDRVTSFDMVTADGKLLQGVTASGPHANLFWASCGGGGGNFGIVTRWVVRLITPPAVVQFARVQFAPDQAAAVLTSFMRWGHTVPAEVSLKLNLESDDDPELLMYSVGADLKKVLAGIKIASLGPKKTTIKQYSFIDAVVEAASRGVDSPEDLISTDWRADGVHRKERSWYLAAPLPAATLRRLVALLAEHPNASIQHHPYGGVIAAKANNATAFPHRRGVIGLVQVQVQWPGDAAGREHAMKWINKAAALLNPYQLGAYVNYMDADVKNWQRAYFGGNYARLQAVKQTYDPSRFFAFPGQAIRPTKARPCVFEPCV